MSTVFMYSGQGSQYYQMGKDLFNHDNTFAHHMKQIDAAIAKVLGMSILEQIYAKGRTFNDPFDDVILSGMAILTLELSLTRTLMEKGLTPDILLGSSFGTLVATVVAQCMTENDAIESLIKHGELFKNEGLAGSMIAVLADAQLYEQNPLLQSLSQLAGVNFDNSFVLSLPLDNLSKVETILKDAGVTYQKLPVTRAYHSRWINSVEQQFLSLYGSKTYQKPQIPIVCTSRSLPLVNVNADTLWQVVRGPINFQKTTQWLETAGPQKAPHTYIDMGPSGTLATFLKYTLPPQSGSTICHILSPFNGSVKNFEQLIAKG